MRSLLVLVTSAKEAVIDPTALNAEMAALLDRLMTTEPSKWAALRELGLKWEEGSA